MEENNEEIKFCPYYGKKKNIMKIFVQIVSIVL